MSNEHSPRFLETITKAIAFALGIPLARQTFMADMQIGSAFGVLSAVVFPATVAAIIGAILGFMRLQRITKSLAWGVFFGALWLWIPVMLNAFFVPVIYVPVLAGYAILLPFTASLVSQKITRRK